MSYCSSCGQEVSKPASYCQMCGNKVSQSGGDQEVVVNVQQSSDHASSNAASSGNGIAEANSETARPDNQEPPENSSNDKVNKDFTKEDYLEGVFLFGLSISVIAMLLSYIIGAYNGMSFTAILTTIPYGIPFWFAGLVLVCALYASYQLVD